MGKGINYLSPDSAFSVRFNLRLQPFLETSSNLDPAIKEHFEVQNTNFPASLKFTGFAYSPKLTYKLELGIANRENESVLQDAYLNWNFRKGLNIAYGQLKLPGNRQRRVSSGGLQFPNRSIVNEVFNLDVDLGFLLFNEFKIGGIRIKDYFSTTVGEGRNKAPAIGGFTYTGRIEILPFGDFTNGGDYYEADIAREPKPKLSLGANVSLNQEATRSGAQTGPALYEQRDILTSHADLMFKLRGFSTYAEYALRDVDNPVTYFPGDSTKSNFIYKGSGFNLQTGYMLPHNYELALRYEFIKPHDQIKYLTIRREQYGIGISKYIQQHFLKIQSDISMVKDKNLFKGTLVKEVLNFRFTVVMEL